ncbi:MAG: cyclic nucleotide-binding domain-containing protein [candidate division Zixibacteria bacterium]
MLTTIEKVVFLQNVDIFEFTSTEDLSHIAVITEEVEFEKGDEIFKEGDISDCMYLIVDGKIRLIRKGSVVMTGVHNDVFGTWALFDDEPRVVTAIVTADSRLLRIQKDDFIDLLGDNVRITQGILKQLAKRLRNLVEKVGSNRKREHNNP